MRSHHANVEQSGRMPWRAIAGALRLLPLTLLVAAVAAFAAAGPLSAMLRPASPGWLAATLTSEMFVRHAALLVGCGVLLAAMVSALWRIGAARRQVRSAGEGEAGVELLEFAIVLPFALMLSLIMAQTSLLMAGNLSVHYAAFAAARSAIVVVPESLPDEPPNKVNAGADWGKTARIRDAAVLTLVAVSPGTPEAPSGDAQAMQTGLTWFFGTYGRPSPPWNASLSRKIQYAGDHTRVELDAPANGDEYAEHEDLVVTVRHDLYLAVPYAASVFRLVDGVRLDWGAGEWATEVTAQCRLSNEGTRDTVDIETFNPNAN